MEPRQSLSLRASMLLLSGLGSAVTLTIERRRDPGSRAGPWPSDVLVLVRERFRLSWTGIHGAPHWARVRAHGLWIARHTGADAAVVSLFALLHDAARHNDGADPGHGARAARFVEQLHRDRLLSLDDTRALWLAEACRGHSDGGLRANPTIQACWDADRLDLGRVGIRPDPRRLCTQVASNPARIEQAWRWATSGRRGDGHSRVTTRPGRDD